MPRRIDRALHRDIIRHNRTAPIRRVKTPEVYCEPFSGRFPEVSAEQSALARLPSALCF
jgi:hypothetical protein